MVRTLRQDLEDIIASAKPGVRLPSDSQLARQLRVPRSTVSRLMSALARQGRCVRVHGSGTYAPANEPTQPPVHFEGPKTASEMLADELQAMIAQGRYRTGEPLPAIKTLCIGMGVAPRTAIDTYRILVARRLAVKAGKSYRVGTISDCVAQGSHRVVTCYVYGNGTPGSLQTGWGLGFAQVKMERELLRMGLRIEYETFDVFARLCRSRRNRELSPFTIVSFIPAERFREYARMARQLVRSRPTVRPSVLLIGDVPDNRRAPALLHTYARGNTATVWARTLARYLFTKRLRRVVLFVDLDRPTYRSLATLLKIYGEHTLLDPRADYTIVIKQAATRSRRMSSGWHCPADEDAVRRLAGKYPVITISELHSRLTAVGNITAAFETASDADVWLFSRDGDAVAALDYCITTGIRVPRDLSIIGLSNDRELLDRGITTCVEDWDTIGYQMAHALIGDVPVARTGRGFVRAAALMIERKTTPING